MRPRLRAALLFLSILLGLGAVAAMPPAPAWACSCVHDDVEMAKRAEVIVVGTVTEVTDSWVRLAVESVEKGDVDRAAPLQLAVAPGDASCGYTFRDGWRYRVNAKDGRTGLCIGVADLPPAPTGSPASTTPTYRVAMPTVPQSSGDRPWPAIGAVSAAVAVAAVVVVLWRRRTR